jgi:predicted adenylyl cyclase CyaB
MPVNLELKVKLKSFNQIKKLLSKINAEFVGVLKQTDIYYKNKEGLLKLRIENGEQSIIKYLRDEKKQDRFSNYKVLRFSQGNAAEFLKSIFKVEAVVNKKRYLYMYDNTRVHLDNVKGLGYFLELETLVVNGKADARKRYNNIITLLSLDKYEELRKSYRDLIMSKNK